MVLFGLGLVALVVLLAGPRFLAWGERRAHEADQQALDQAVQRYVASQPTLRLWPTLSGGIGSPTEGAIRGYQCDGSDGSERCSWVDIGLLVEVGGLESAEVINSADSSLNATATNAPSGAYGWYLTSNGLAASVPPYSREVGYP